MPLNRMTRRRTTAVLLVVLLLEAVLVVLLRWLGWYGTGNAIQLAACLVVTFLPLLFALAALVRRKLKFSIQSLMAATLLVAIFLVLSLMPLVQHRATRHTSMQLLSANATINEGLDWDDFYAQVGLEAPPRIETTTSKAVPAWLTPFTSATDQIPTDGAVRSIWINNDAQCRILAENWESLPSLQSVSFSRGVSTNGLNSLRDILPQLAHLDIVHTNDVAVPPSWYGSLTNIRALWVWGEGASRGTQFDKEHLNDIVSLPNLEMLMVLGYAFDDDNARQLSNSNSIKRVILRGTAVTPTGESDLANASRVVYRN